MKQAWLRTLLHRYRYYLSAIIVLQLVAAALIAAQPMVLQKIIANAMAIEQRDTMVWQALLVPVLFLCALYLAVSLGQVLTGLLGSRFSANVMKDLQMQFLTHASHLPLSYFRNERSGEMMTRFNHDIGLIQNLLAGLGPQMLKEGLTCVMLVAVLTVLCPIELVALTVILIAAVVGFVVWLNKKLYGYAAEQRKQWSGINHHFDEMIKGIETIKAYCTEKQTKKVFAEKTQAFRNVSLRFGKFVAIASPGGDLMIRLGGLLPLLLAFLLINQGQLSLSSFLVYFFCASLLMSSIAMIVNGVNGLQPMWVAVNNMAEFFQFEQESENKSVSVEDINSLPDNIESIEFRNISFSYDGKNKALDNFSMSFYKGQLNELSGPNGAGKSTLMELLLGFIPLQQGEIVINGKKANQAMLKALRAKTALVASGQYLFAGTIRENLLLANPRATDEQMQKTLDEVNFHLADKRFINELDIQLTENASNLSDGERQKLILARAFLSEKKILVLDEPLVSVDTFSSKEICKYIKEMCEYSLFVLVGNTGSSTEKVTSLKISG